MSPEQFAYWLQGFVELNKGAAPDAEQWTSIKEHLGTVFTKVTPPVGAPAHVAPIPTPEVYCVHCGAPRSNHHYRHPFVAAVTDDEKRVAFQKFLAKKPFNEPMPISRGIYPGRIC